MSYAYDQNKNIAYAYCYDGAVYTARNITTGDYFDDDAGVGDCLYFGIYSPCVPFHNITFNIGTSLVADSITVAWEYDKEGVWTAIPSVTDNTNAFQASGSQTVEFPVPPDFGHTASTFYYSNFPNTEDALWVRCRITAVTNISEGGANTTTAIYVNDNTITVTDESSFGFSDIYSADVSGSWGVVTNTQAQYFINAALYLSNSNLVSTMEQVQIGQEEYCVGLGGNSGSSFSFGSKNSEGFGYNGSSIELYTKGGRGFSIYNLYLYGSIFHKYGGSWSSPTLSDDIDIRDSTLSGDYWYFNSGVNADSAFVRSVYACSYYFYCYTGNIAIDKLYLPYDTVSCDGILLGSGNARVDNTSLDATQQIIRRYYGCNVSLVNCSFANTDWSTETGVFSLNNSSSAGTDWYVKVYYTFDLTVVDEEGNAIEGARVFLTDGQGNTVIEPTLSGLEFSDTIYNAIMPTLMDWASPPAYDSDMIGGTVTMTSGTYSGQKSIVTGGGAQGWSGAGYPYFTLVDSISETSATFDFSKWGSGVTDSNGQIDQEECLVWDAYIDYSDSWSRQNVDHKDYVLRIEKTGYEPFEHRWDFKSSQQVDLRITLKKNKVIGG